MIRLLTKTTKLAFDLALLLAAFWLAFGIRFEGEVPAQMFKRLLFLGPYVVALEYGMLSAFGVPRFSWRYFGLRETTRVLTAAAASAGIFLLVRLAAAVFFDAATGPAQYVAIPIGVILINFGLVFLGIAGARASLRIQTERTHSQRRRLNAPKRVPTMLVGAGQAGLLVAKELATRPDLGLAPVGFIDDDPAKLGAVVHGIPVLGKSSALRQLCQKVGAQQVLITIANAPGAQIRRLKTLCDEAGLPAKIIPGIYEIVGGQVNLSRIRNVTIEDLLGREAVELELDAIGSKLGGQVVLVSGAGGSIGSELCRQICRFGPKRLVLLERAENALFDIHRELAALFPATEIAPCIGDICDAARVSAIFDRHRPQAVFHAAAHKHVPMMEWNPGEAIRNNVLGTRLLADAAHEYGVGEFVMISTDKAVNPSSVMGASKRMAEIYIQGMSERSKTRFVAVRFGNVLGSAGSVIPIFKEQIAKGGPVTVTHPEMQRYFMTIPEACQLVLQAGSMGRGGEIFVLDMGQPVKIVDLARDLITLSGLCPGEDIEVVFSGVRPGEKLFEELSVAEEGADKTRHPKIFVGRIKPHDWVEIVAGIDRLRKVVDAPDGQTVREVFQQLVPEYRWPEADVLPKTETANGEPSAARPLAAAR